MWIQTATGKKFDLLNPTPEQVDGADIVAALPLIPCFTGQQAAGRYAFAYSVAQHCLFVSRIVPKELALDALLHDAWKVYVGDLTRPLNQLLNGISGGEWSNVRGRIQQVVARKFGTNFPLPEEVEDADMQARANELRDIMAPVPEPWSLNLPEPTDEIIVPLHPDIVRQQFLYRWLELSDVKAQAIR